MGQTLFLTGILVAEIWLISFLIRPSKIYFQQKDCRLAVGRKCVLFGAIIFRQ